MPCTFQTSLPSVVASGQSIVAGSEAPGSSKHSASARVPGYGMVIWETGSIHGGWVKMEERMFLISICSFIWSYFFLALSGLDLT